VSPSFCLRFEVRSVEQHGKFCVCSGSVRIDAGCGASFILVLNGALNIGCGGEAEWKVASTLMFFKIAQQASVVCKCTLRSG
jgi:hypothetical protein